jgi:quinolinate synthase
MRYGGIELSEQKEELVSRIEKLKKQRNAIILVHNYQIGEVQDIADYTGDSLGLSIKASKTKADVIVFCGVHFMAETASILCPNKTVLLPDRYAGCPMADMITAKQLRDLKQKHPHAVVVGYVNTTADVKAELDICCTSANATGVIESLARKEKIIFVPDKYLGGYSAQMAKRELILWQGYCPVHVMILPEHIKKARLMHPAAEVLIHPECTPAAIELADQVLSTGGMSRYVAKSPCKEFIIATEVGMLYRLKKDNPGKDFYAASELAVCKNMKRITLEKVLWALENMQFRIKVNERISKKASIAIKRMIEVV